MVAIRSGYIKNKGVNMTRIYEAKRTAYRKMKIFRDNYRDHVREMVGSHYSNNGTSYNNPVNMINEMIMIYMINVMPRTPAASVFAKADMLYDSAFMLEIALNHLLEHEINYGSYLQRSVRNSMFSLAVHKVGLTNSKSVEIGGVQHDVGQPFADSINPDDWVHDMEAKTWETVSFEGNRFRVPKMQLEKSGLYDKKFLKDLPESSPRRYKEGEYGILELSSEPDAYEAEIYDMADLWELYLPLEGKVITISDCQSDGDAGRIVDWNGPERGPYHKLSLNEVPGQLMPLAPVATLIDLHQSINYVMRKLQRQAERQKNLTVGNKGDDLDIQTVQRSGDGDYVTLDQPSSIQELSFGGPNQMTMAFLIQNRELFSILAGGLDVLSGTTQQADTFGQERLLNTSSSKRMEDIRQKVRVWNKGIVEDIAFWMMSDPLFRMPLTYKDQATGMQTDFVMEKEDIEGDYNQYNYEINPYSDVHMDPPQKVNFLMSYIGQIAGLLQLAMDPNSPIDMDFFNQEIAKNANYPELEKLIRFSGVPQQPIESSGGDHEQRQAPVTTRNHVRTNRSEVTQAGKDKTTLQALMGKRSQPNEQISMLGI